MEAFNSVAQSASYSGKLIHTIQTTKLKNGVLEKDKK